jgi:hypothetical protein
VIYPDVPLSVWTARYAGLSQFEKLTCHCGQPSRGFRPLRFKGYAAIEARPCSCGRAGASVATPTCPQLTNKWLRVMSEI